MAKTADKKVAAATNLSPKQVAAQRTKNKAAAKKVAAARKEAMVQADGLEVTDVSEWKKDTTGQRAETKLKLPSGKVCLVKVVGMEPFFKQGLIPNNLLPLVSSAISEGKGITAKETAALVTDPAMIAAMLELSDRVICEVVIQPPVTMPPADSKDRDDSVLYADEVDLQDKFFIFQFVVGGTRDLEQFRDKQEAALADVADVEAVPAETE